MNLREEIYNYIKSGETTCERLGVEIEHFVLTDEGYPISFNLMSQVIEDVADRNGFDIICSDGYVVGCSNNKYTISLEPSCQFEISISPMSSIAEIERIYRGFYALWEKEFINLGYNLITKAYLPLVEKGEITPDDIPLSPKKRYEYMDRYFAHTGKCGKYMMRASASTQISIDYRSEQDLVRKLRLLQKLSPILMIMSENKTYEDAVLTGIIDKPHLFRTQQWDNLDSDRTGFFPHSFDDDFGYESIADTIYNMPLILLTNGDNTSFVSDKSAKQLIDEGVINESELDSVRSRGFVEHFLSMGFFHLRIKTYIEIRIADSVPIDRALGLVALLKGIAYSEDNMKILEDELFDINSAEMIQNAIEKIEEDGFDAVIYKNKSAREWADRLIELARNGLSSEETAYLEMLKA